MDIQNNAHGFTFIELMIAVAITSILLGLAVPSFSIFLKTIQLKSLSGALTSSLQEARSESIKRNARVLVCASNSDGTDCKSSASASDWGSAGWLVCYDIDADGSCDASTTSLPNPFRRNNAIDTTILTMSGPTTAIRFNPTGSQGAVGAATASLTVTGTWSGAATTTVTVAASGLIKST